MCTRRRISLALRNAGRCPLTALTAGLLVVALPTAGWAQAPQCPRPALARLAQTVGRWHVTWRWGWGVDDDSTVVQGASATIELVADKCGLLERLTGTLRGRPLAIADLVTAPSADTLQRAYVDSEHGALLLMTGQTIGDTVRLLWSKDLGTRRLLVRHAYFNITPTGFETRTWTSPNGGTDWVLVQRASYRR